MNITLSIRKYCATALMTAGLVYPACAAVCPKGIGGCTSPGRCFLFTDADGNSLCDYTAGSGSSSHTFTVQAPSAAQPSATPATAQAASDTASSPAMTTAIPALSLATLLAGTFLFIALCGVLYTSVRKGFLGIRIEQPGPALAFSSLVSLGFSLMAVFILAGGALQSMTCAVVYLGAGTLLSAYLWHEKAMTRRVILVLAGVGTLAGFVFAAPVMPEEFIGLFNTLTGASALTGAIVILCAIIVLGTGIGRAFCGHICPVGSLQELAYAVPTAKARGPHPATFEVIRLAVFGATVLAAVYALDLMALTGLYELFSLTVSVVLVIAIALVLLSVFVYRPVCRLICPFGVLFSITAAFSFFRLRRNSTCILCKKCERACPAACAGADDTKRECYLCGRCTEACPVKGALTYRR